MRRHATMGLAFVLPLAVSFMAYAQQPKAAAAKKTDAGVAASTIGAADAGTGAASATTSTSASSSTSDGGVTAVATSGPSTTSSSSAGRPAMDGATYAVRLRDLEARVDELKDQIRRSHTRLSLLSDTIMSGGAAGARAEVLFENEMSSAFRLVRGLVVMDGAVQYNRQDDTGALSDQKQIPIFSGSIPPGDHTLQVLLNYQGNGFGVFTYLRGYKFEVKSSHSFTVAEGKTITVTAIGLEKGGVTTPLEQRPAIDWREKIQAISASSVAAAPGGATPSSGTPTTAPATSAGGSGNLSIGGGTK